MDFKHTTLPIEEKLPKLIRDNIPQIIRDREKLEPIYHVAESEEFINMAWQKIIEEATEGEFSQSRDEAAVELADIKELLMALMRELKISNEEVDAIRVEKNRKNGAFEKRYILDRK